MEILLLMSLRIDLYSIMSVIGEGVKGWSIEELVLFGLDDKISKMSICFERCMSIASAPIALIILNISPIEYLLA